MKTRFLTMFLVLLLAVPAYAGYTRATKSQVSISDGTNTVTLTPDANGLSVSGAISTNSLGVGLPNLSGGTHVDLDNKTGFYIKGKQPHLLVEGDNETIFSGGGTMLAGNSFSINFESIYSPSILTGGGKSALASVNLRSRVLEYLAINEDSGDTFDISHTTFNYIIEETLETKTAGDAGFLGATVNADKWGVWRVEIASGGTVTMIPAAGGSNLNASTANAAWALVPEPSDGKATMGFIVVEAHESNPFIPGTTHWDDVGNVPQTFEFYNAVPIGDDVNKLSYEYQETTGIHELSPDGLRLATGTHSTSSCIRWLIPGTSEQAGYKYLLSADVKFYAAIDSSCITYGNMAGIGLTNFSWSTGGHTMLATYELSAGTLSDIVGITSTLAVTEPASIITADSNWHSVMMLWDSSTGKYEWYLDGDLYLSSTETASTHASPLSGAGVYWGAMAHGNYETNALGSDQQIEVKNLNIFRLKENDD